MTKEMLIDELADIILSGDAKLMDIQKEIGRVCSKKKFEKENEYFKHMYSQFEKLGYNVSYERIKMSIYVLEKIHGGVDSIDNLITRISLSTGTTEKMIRQNMFSDLYVIYSGLKYAMVKYIKNEKNVEIKIKPEEFWKTIDESVKMKLYVELEKYLYNL